MEEKEKEIERIEILLLVEALCKRYGYDFRGYSKSFLERRVRRRMEILGEPGVSHLIHRMLRDEKLAKTLIADFSISTTEMFRDPPFFRSLREKVVPELACRKSIDVWVAGCATGEEVYSLAILLREEGLYDSARIHATDISEENLAKARDGIFPNRLMKGYGENYYAAGGKEEFSDYFLADDMFALMRSFLKKNVEFSLHNLAVDDVFGEMDLILCRNVLIYFGKELKERAVGLLSRSLRVGGYLCLGSKESVEFLSAGKCFREVDGKWKIYGKIEESPEGKPVSHDLPGREEEIIERVSPDLLVVIGASSGGMPLVKSLLAEFGDGFPAPVLVVFHRHKSSSPDLVDLMKVKGGMELKEAEDGDVMRGSVAYVAPADYHMSVNGEGVLELTLEDPVNFARPSIDVTFKTAASAMGERVVGILLSGATRDGVEGLKEIKKRGGVAIVQNPDTAESPFMPRCAVEEGAAETVLEPGEIARFVIERIKTARCR